MATFISHGVHNYVYSYHIVTGLPHYSYHYCDGDTTLITSVLTRVGTTYRSKVFFRINLIANMVSEIVY